MRCRDAERWLLRDLDGRLSSPAKENLEAHLRECRDCAERKEDYVLILGALRSEPASPSDDFVARLKVKLDKTEKAPPWAWMGEWSLRAVPFVLILILSLLAMALFFPPKSGDLGQTEALLLRNENPDLETRALLEETRLEKKNLMLIFAAEEKSPTRSYIP